MATLLPFRPIPAHHLDLILLLCVPTLICYAAIVSILFFLDQFTPSTFHLEALVSIQLLTAVGQKILSIQSSSGGQSIDRIWFRSFILSLSADHGTTTRSKMVVSEVSMRSPDAVLQGPIVVSDKFYSASAAVDSSSALRGCW